MQNDQQTENDQENTSFLGRLKAGVTEALFTDDEPQKPKTVSEKSASPAVEPTVVNTQMVSKEERINAVKILSTQVFVDKSAYLDYRDTFDALEGSVTPDENRRKAALAVASKKHGIAAVAQAIKAHEHRLIQERSVFEASLSPVAENPLTALEKNIQTNEQLIQTKRQEIEKLQSEISTLIQENSTLQNKISAERAKHEHARAVFEAAYQELEQSIKSDEALITSQLPKEA